ncbi:MAG: extracellular solute-binding protein [Desulfobacterales bacterium]|nr:extracellular solute-binding protein [Desulfobacterales bacterium]
MNRRITKCMILIICGGLLVARPFPARSDPLDPYIAAAKKEGSVRLGVTLREEVHGVSAADKYFDVFQKRYPFLKVSFKRIGGVRERERVINEMAGGIHNYDVVPVSETMVPTIVGAKLPRVVDWVKLGAPQFLAHPENLGVSLRTPIFGIAYNRDLVPDEVARTFTWETCADPKWKGKGAGHSRPRHLNVLYREIWGREKTLDYAKRWMANRPAVEGSRSTLSSKVQAGAYHFLCGIPRTQIKDLQVYGDAKNLGIVFPEPVPVGTGDLIWVPEKAKHPNAGILFVVWSATKEGQNLLDEVNFSGHPAVEGNEVHELLKGKQIAFFKWEDSQYGDDDLAEILTAMGMPVVRSKSKRKK